MREHAIRELSRRDTPPERRRILEAVLAQQQVHFFEVKTLLTSQVGAVRISGAAMKRKERWARKYGAAFHLVALDDRRGKKHSGNRVYVAANELGGTTHLANMKPVGNMAGVLRHATGDAP